MPVLRLQCHCNAGGQAYSQIRSRAVWRLIVAIDKDKLNKFVQPRVRGAAVTRMVTFAVVVLAAGALVGIGPARAPASTCVSWTGSGPANPAIDGDALTGVSALTPCDVWAVGYQQVGVNSQTLTEHWNGLAWTPVPSANPGGSSYDTGFAAVAVKSPADAWAVGSYQDGSANQTLIELLSNGNWEQVSSVDPGGSTHVSLLNDVAISSAKNAWAVGEYKTGTAFRTLIENWNGGTWVQVPSPNGSASDNDLLGVTAISAKNAWAVGYSTTSHGLFQTLVEHWNGTDWKRMPSPDPEGSSGSASLFGVAASSPSSAWAVGDYFKGGIAQALIMRWNGKKWKLAAAPSLDKASVDGSLSSVAVVSATNVWAVGTLNGRLTLAAHWNGSTWSKVPSPDPGSFSEFSTVAASSATDVWAVGTYAQGADLTLAVHC
jgi:hypothetical protein